MRAREEHDDMIRRRLDSAGSETDDDDDVEDDEMLVEGQDGSGGAKRMYISQRWGGGLYSIRANGIYRWFAYNL